MGDELEKFIIQNRAEFEKEEPSRSVWQKIQSELKPKTHLAGWWKVAAVIFLISTVYLLVDRSFRQDYLQQQVNSDSEMIEFQQVESFYSQLIQDKRKELQTESKATAAERALSKDFLEEIDRLDKSYDDLKEIYQKQYSSDKLKGALISNLKLRIQILDQQLKILKKINEIDNETDTSLEI